MNDFDRFLESGLRQMLDPVAATRAPRRRRRDMKGRPLLTVISGPIAPVGEATPALEPAAAPVLARLIS